MRRGEGDRQKLFKYVTTDEAPEYRTIMDVFVDAAAQYRSALTLDDVDSDLRSFEPPLILSREVLERRLAQLHVWGNLDRDRDESWATDLRTYELQAYLYTVSRGGEAAHEAVVTMEEGLRRAVGLQKVALLRVQALLTDLIPQLAAEQTNGAEVYTLVEELHRTFKALTGNAATFLQKVNRVVDSGSIKLDDFRIFKADTIHYLTEFTDNLQSVTDSVVPQLARLDTLGETRLVAALAVAAKESGEQMLVSDEATESWADQARRHLNGVRRWFVPEPGAEGGGEHLHRVVRRAVLGIGRAVERLREAQLARSSRTADLLALAKQFRALDNDDAGHEVWHRRFGLNSSRHFCDEAVDESIPYSRDWWSAPSALYSLKLRAISTPDELVRRASRTANHADTKRLLAEAARNRHLAADAAADRLVALGRVRLSQVESTFEPIALMILVELLSRAQRAKRDPGTARRTARSVDGRLRISLTPPPGGAAARLTSHAGHLTLLDYEVEITRTS
ncbi:TIGR02677 family protein [Amycolatopsis sp. NPDC005003]